MIVRAYFSENGLPKTGLSPLVDIARLSDNTLVVDDGAMSPLILPGRYYYDFVGYDASEAYDTLADSVTLTGDERYAIGALEDSSMIGAINERTANLPDDPADQSEIEAQLVLIYNEVAGLNGATMRGTDGVPLNPLLANDARLDRILGLSHENIFIDQTAYDADNNLISARLRVYSNAGSVGTDQDILATYTITADGSGVNKFTSWKQVKG